MKNKKIFPYAGSKERLLLDIMLLFSVSSTELIELCGGSGVISLNTLGMFEKTTYNEYDSHICRIFSMLKDTDTQEELIRRIVKAPCNSKYFAESQENYENNFKSVDDDFTKAVQTYVTISQSFMNGIETSFAGKYPNPRELRLNLNEAANELRHIEISNEDCFKLIEEHREPYKTLLIDPPYFEENFYKKKWGIKEHTHLAESVFDSGAKIMIAGRSTPCYDEVFSQNPKKWVKLFLCRLPSPNNKGGNAQPKDEYLYINYNDYSLSATRTDIIEVPFFQTIHDLDD